MHHYRKTGFFKRIVFVSLAVFLLSGSVAFSQESAAGKTLIMYYTRTGNTKMTCEALQKALDAQVIEIKDLNDRSGAWGGLTGMLNTLFSMETSIEPEHPDLAPYANIILASPLWAGKLAPAIRTVIARNRFDNKNVAIFTTGNAILDEPNQEKNKQAIIASGGKVVGYFQVAVQEKIDDKKIDKPKEKVVEETLKLVPAIKKAFTIQ